MKTVIHDIGFSAKCLIFDSGVFLDSTNTYDKLSKQTVVITCSSRIATRQSMRKDAQKFFSDATIFDFYALYFHWISTIVQRKCDMTVFAETLCLCREEKAIPNIDSINTLYCNLMCKECSNGIQYRTSRWRIDAVSQITHMKKITDILPIAQCNFQGGEVFTDVGFTKFLEAHACNPRLAFLTVATNGTILPSEHVFSTMKSIGCMIRISDYGELSKQREALIQKCKEYDIPCFIFPMAEKWRRFGPYEKRGRSKKELISIRDQCCFGTHDLMFLDDKFYCCLRTLFASAIGDVNNDIVANTLDLDSDFTAEELAAFVRGDELWRMCDYCDFPMTLIEPAEQIEKSR